MRSHGSRTAVWVTFVAVTTCGVVDVLVPGLTLAERATFGVLGLVVAGSLSLDLPSLRLPRREWWLVAGWCLLVSAALLPTLSQHHLYPMYVAGDYLSLMLPAGLYLVAARHGEGFGLRALTTLTVVLAVAAAAAAILGLEAPRHEAPAALAVAFSWYRVATAANARTLASWLTVALALVVLGFSSGQRTSIVLWSGGAAYALLVGLLSRRAWPALFALLSLIAIVTAGPTIGEAVERLMRGTRHAALVAGETDASVLARLAEADDVAATFEYEGQTSRWLSGLGHGATYEPRRSFLVRNVTEHGRVHNVHIGPIAVWFRYGLTGIVVWLTLVILAVHSSLAAIGRPAAAKGAFGFIVLTMIAEGLVFNVLVDPLFAFAVAGMLLTRRRPRSDG